MKTKQLIAISAVIIVGLTSCEKDLYDPSQHPEEKKVTDLVVPAHFDWVMTKATTCRVTSNHSAQLSIYLNEACSEDNLLATLSVNAETDATLPLSLLKNTRQVYVQYENAAGKKVVATAPVEADGNISFATPADAVSTKTLTRAAEATADTLYYPHKGNGTIMFEDNYPALGDYDFNDFVARYSIKVKLSSDKLWVEKIMMTMNVVAIGGITPYIPCLRLPYSSTMIAEAKVEGVKGFADPQITLEQIADKDAKKNAVFILHGAEKNANKENQFLNTQKGTRFVETKKFTLTVTLEEGWALTGNLNKDFFDIFLVSSDKSKEIHMLGYNPAFEQPNDNQSVYYDTKKNPTYKGEKGLVWAINIPSGEVAHAYEKENFIKGYPDFAVWASSGGAEAQEWYTKSNSNYLFLIPSNK